MQKIKIIGVIIVALFYGLASNSSAQVIDSGGANTNIVGQFSITPDALPEGVVGGAYNAVVKYSETYAPDPARLYSATFTNLPPGLYVGEPGSTAIVNLPSSSGSITIAGVPTQAGDFNVTVAFYTADRVLAQRSYIIKINNQTQNPQLAITPDTLPGGTLNPAYPYSATISYSGLPSDLTKTYTAVFSTLPPGLYVGTTGSLSISGLPSGSGNLEIKGQPTQAKVGSYHFTLTIYEGQTIVGQKDYTIGVDDIAPSKAVINPETLPDGRVGVEYFGLITYSTYLSSKTYPTTTPFTASFASLPPGLYVGEPGSLRITGLPANSGSIMIKGVPTAAGDYKLPVELYVDYSGGLSMAVGSTNLNLAIKEAWPSTSLSQENASTSNATASSVNLINAEGTYYLVSNNQRLGITNPGILNTYGFEFKDAKPATQEDLSLSQGQILLPNNGSLVKSAEDPTVYLISGNQKHGFTSAKVFTDLGYKFSSVYVVTAPELDRLTAGPLLADSQLPHSDGVNINDNGTIYWINNQTRYPYPSLEVYNSWNIDNDFSSVVPANDADKALSVGEKVQMRVAE